jgi:hypothetical protein
MDKDGHLIVPNGVTLGVAVDAYAASNTLDDYEEGTFTPVIADASTGGNTGTATTLDGYYTKIGRQVTAFCTISDMNTTGMTGANNLFIRGLPFAAATTTLGSTEGSARLDRIALGASVGCITCSTVQGTSHLLIRQTIDSAADLIVKVQDVTSGTADAILCITYQT